MAANQAIGDDALDTIGMDYPAHLESYHLFTSLIKWGTVSVILIVLLLAFLTL